MFCQNKHENTCMHANNTCAHVNRCGHIHIFEQAQIKYEEAHKYKLRI